MISLPLDSRVNYWRDMVDQANSRLAQARLDAADVPQIPAGTHPYSTQLKLSDGQVYRGTLGSNGERLTTLDFSKSLYQLYGTGKWGPSGSPGYSYPDSDALVSLVSGRPILADLNIRMPTLPCPAHHYERGFHGIDIGSSASPVGWNLEIINAENSFILDGQGSVFEDVTLSWEPGRTPNNEGMLAHYGVSLHGSRCVLHKLRVNGLTHHDLDIQAGFDNVAWGLQGPHFRISFHATSIDEDDDHNLIGDVNLGQVSSRTFHHTGASSNKPWTGDYTTFYNIRKGDGTQLPASSYPSWITNKTVILVSGEAPPPPPEEPPVPSLIVGDRVTPINLVIVRSGPAKATSKLGEQSPGAEGQVVGGETFDPASGFTYVQVNWDSGADGWCGTDRLAKVTAPVSARERAEQKLVSLGLTVEEAASL